MADSPGPTRRPAAARAIAAALHVLGVALLAHLGFGVFRHGIDLDEFQFLHEGWLMAQGQRQYVDFWEDHGPLQPFVCSVFYRLGGSGDATALVLYRSVGYAAVLATAAFVYAIARRLRPRDGVFAGLALALYAASPVLGHKGIEVRSDGLLQPIVATSLFLWLRAAQTRSVRGFFFAGLALGAGFWATQKTVMPGVAIGAAFAVWLLAERRFAWREVASFGAGSLVGPALLALVQWRGGAWDAFIAAYVSDSARARIPATQGYASLRNEAPLASALAIAALIVAAVRASQRRLPFAVASFFAFSATFVLLYLFALPMHFLHSLLPAAAPVALATAWALREAIVGSARIGTRGFVARGALLLAAAIAVGAFESSVRRYAKGALANDLADGARVAAWVPPAAVLFDGGRLPVERPRALPTPSLVIHVQRQIQAGRYPLDVRTELDRRDVAWWRLDGRARSLERQLAEYRKANFLLVDRDLWAAGQLLLPDRNGGADLPVRVGGAYWWRTRSGGGLRIDGAPAPNPVTLADGPHRAAWEGPGALLLSVVPSERWPAALARMLEARAPPPAIR